MYYLMVPSDLCAGIVQSNLFSLFSYGDLVFVKDVSGTKFCEGYIVYMSHKYPVYSGQKLAFIGS